MISYGLIFKLFLIALYIPFFIRRIKRHDTAVQCIASLLFCAYLISIIGIVFFPIMFEVAIPTFTFKSAINIIPFKTILEIQRNLSFSTFSKQVFGNVILFIPFGFFIPLVNEKAQKISYIITISFLASLGIELVQLVIDIITQHLNRIVDIDDIILNVFGAIIGFGLLKLTKMVLNKLDCNILDF